MSTLVPAGSVLERVYYAVPDHHTSGPEFDTLHDAADEARRRKDQGWHRHTEGVRVWIDERWVMKHPDPNAHQRGGHTDLVVCRTEYAPAETREQWTAQPPSPTPAAS